MAFDIATWPGLLMLGNDDDLGYTDISASLSGLGTLDLETIWAPCADQLWTGGQSGNMWHLSGGSWAVDATHPFGGSRLRTFWGPDCNTIFCGANAGKIAKWTESGLWGALQSTPISEVIRGIQGNDEQVVWAVANSGKVLLTTNGGTTWNAISNPFSGNLFGLAATSDQEMFACGVSGQIIHTDDQGDSWTTQTTPNTATTNWMWASESRDPITGLANEVWAVQNGGTILFYDGGTWTQQVDLGTDNIFGIIGSNNSNIYAVGGSTSVIVWRFDGSSWTEIFNGGTNDGNAVAFAPGSVPYVVGDSGNIFRSDTLFDLVDGFILKMPLPQQPEQPGVLNIVGEIPTGTTLPMELKGSHRNQWNGEEKRIIDVSPGIVSVPDSFRFYRIFGDMAPNVARDMTPVLDRIRLSFAS